MIVGLIIMFGALSELVDDVLLVYFYVYGGMMVVRGVLDLVLMFNVQGAFIVY